MVQPKIWFKTSSRELLFEERQVERRKELRTFVFNLSLPFATVRSAALHNCGLHSSVDSPCEHCSHFSCTPHKAKRRRMGFERKITEQMANSSYLWEQKKVYNPFSLERQFSPPLWFEPSFLSSRIEGKPLSIACIMITSVFRWKGEAFTSKWLK